MAEIPNNSAALNYTPKVLPTSSVLSQSAIANKNKVLQTPSGGISNIWWTDKSGNIVNEVPYGESMTLNITTIMSGLSFSVSLSANSNVFFGQSFISNTSGKASLKIDTKNNNPIGGESSISGTITYFNNTGAGSVVTDVPIIKVSIITYLPTIMKAKGWTIGVRCMEKWFNNPYNPSQTKTDLVVSNILKMDWVLSFGYLKKIIENGFTTITESVFSAAIRDKLKERIKAQVRNNLIRLPENENQTISFGTKDSTPERSAIENHLVTRFDRYYIHQELYRSASGAILGQGEIVPTINDFYAAVANCAFRYIALGDITKIGGKYKIQVKQLGVYVYDIFDFDGEQDLGYWNVKTNDVGRTSIGGGSQGTLVTNKMFRDWRDRNRKGQDYTNYSDVSIRDVNLAFEASESELKP